MSPLKVIAPEEMHFVAFWTMVGVFPIENETKISKLITYTQFVYFGPQIKFCGWTYKMNFCMPISKNREKRSSIIEVQII